MAEIDAEYMKACTRHCNQRNRMISLRERTIQLQPDCLTVRRFAWSRSLIRSKRCLSILSVILRAIALLLSSDPNIGELIGFAFLCCFKSLEQISAASTSAPLPDEKHSEACKNVCLHRDKSNYSSCDRAQHIVIWPYGTRIDHCVDYFNCRTMID